MIWKGLILLSVALMAHSHRPAISEQEVMLKLSPEYRGHHGELGHIGEAPKEHEGYAPSYPAYKFSYRVEDPHTHDFKGQKEEREGDVVKGEYWLIQPDGLKRTVEYESDKHSGFKAKVHYSKVHHENEIEPRIVEHKSKIEHKPVEHKPVEHKEHHEHKPVHHHESGPIWLNKPVYEHKMKPIMVSPHVHHHEERENEVQKGEERRGEERRGEERRGEERRGEERRGEERRGEERRAEERRGEERRGEERRGEERRGEERRGEERRVEERRNEEHVEHYEIHEPHLPTILNPRKIAIENYDIHKPSYHYEPERHSAKPIVVPEAYEHHPRYYRQNKLRKMKFVRKENLQH